MLTTTLALIGAVTVARLAVGCLVSNVCRKVEEYRWKMAIVRDMERKGLDIDGRPFRA